MTALDWNYQGTFTIANVNANKSNSYIFKDTLRNLFKNRYHKLNENLLLTDYSDDANYTRICTIMNHREEKESLEYLILWKEDIRFWLQAKSILTASMMKQYVSFLWNRQNTLN